MSPLDPKEKPPGKRSGPGKTPGRASSKRTDNNTGSSLLPQSRESELAIVGTVLAHPVESLAALAVAGLTSTHLLDPKLGQVLDAAQKLHADGRPVTLDEVALVIEDRGLTGFVGGRTRLRELAALARPDHIDVAGALVLAKAIDRERLGIVADLERAATSGDNRRWTLGIAEAGKLRSVGDSGLAGVLRGSAILDMETPQPLVDRWLPLGGFAMMYAPPKAYKSYLALDLAARVSLGLPFAGRATVQRPVLYLALESGTINAGRLRAWTIRNRKALGDDFHHRAGRLALTDLNNLRLVEQYVCEHDIGLIVIDTAARAMIGTPENDASASMVFVDSLDLLRERTGAAIMLVHHTGKAKELGARGSNAFLAAVDLECSVTRNAGGAVMTTTATKNYDEGSAQRFAMVVVDLGPGREINLCAEYVGFEDENTSNTEVEKLVLLVLGEADTALSPSVLEKMTEINNRTLRRTLQRLVEAGQILKNGSDSRPTYSKPDNRTQTGQAA
jgi:hypothetical protein